MHRYAVKHIDRDGSWDTAIVMANSKGEARKIAEDRGCEDVCQVRRIGWPILPIVIVSLVIAVIVFVLK